MSLIRKWHGLLTEQRVPLAVANSTTHSQEVVTATYQGALGFILEPLSMFHNIAEGCNSLKSFLSTLSSTV